MSESHIPTSRDHASLFLPMAETAVTEKLRLPAGLAGRRVPYDSMIGRADARSTMLFWATIDSPKPWLRKTDPTARSWWLRSSPGRQYSKAM